jgi:hypothetical protein
MTDLTNATKIAAELEKSEGWRKRGRTATAIAAAVIAAIPIAGSPLSVLCDKVGSALVDPNIEAKFGELCNLIAALAPDIQRIDELDAKISVTAAALKVKQGAMDRLVELLNHVYPRAADVFGVKTVGARQEFVSVVVRDMDVLIEAHQLGVNYLKGFRTKGGGVQFDATGGSQQRVEDRSFSGRSGGSVGMDKLVLQGRVGTLTDHPEHPGIGFGEGGSIGFGPGGVLAFGPGKRKG